MEENTDTGMAIGFIMVASIIIGMATNPIIGASMVTGAATGPVGPAACEIEPKNQC